MKIGSISENHNLEKRIAITPDIVKKYISLGFEIFLSKNYGLHLGISDKEYLDLGSKISDDKEILSNSQVIDILQIDPSDKVIFGTTVTVINSDSDQSAQYKIVGEDEADTKLGKISFAAPLAKQMIGKFEGDIVKVETPGGSTEYEIQKVEYI